LCLPSPKYTLGPESRGYQEATPEIVPTAKALIQLQVGTSG
jgi:hypothetical protein